MVKRENIISSIAAQSLLQNNNLNNNHNPVVVSNNYPPPLQLGTIPDTNKLNNNFTFPPSLPVNNNNNMSMDIQSLINTIANGNTSPQSGDSNTTCNTIPTLPKINIKTQVSNNSNNPINYIK